MPRIIYSPVSRIKRPLILFREMWTDLINSHGLAYQFFIRDIKAQYRQTLLGVMWLFIPPIIMAVTLSIAAEAQVINFGETNIPYLAYVIISMTIWQTFTESIEAPVRAIENSKSILVKINFPRESMILAKLIQIIVNFALKLALITVVIVYFKIHVTWHVILMPIVLLGMILLGIAFGVLIATFAILYHDFSKALTILTGIWFFLTPVIYPFPQANNLFSTIVYFNPVTHYLVALRDLLVNGKITNTSELIYVMLITIILLLLVWILSRLSAPYIIERISS